MAKHIHRKEAKKEARQALERHKDILKNIEKHALTANEGKDDFLYLMAIPMIYAAWEGYFKITCAICLKRFCLRGQKYKSYPDSYATLWLQKEKFLNSFFDKLFSSVSFGKKPKKLSAGRFASLASFSQNIKEWLETPIDHLTNFDELVMTYSTVNKEVT